MRKKDRFPWLSHRTLAEVTEHQALARLLAASMYDWDVLAGPGEWHAALERFNQLTGRAVPPGADVA